MVVIGNPHLQHQTMPYIYIQIYYITTYLSNMLLEDLRRWQHVIQAGASVTHIINIKEHRALNSFFIEHGLAAITA